MSSLHISTLKYPRMSPHTTPPPGKPKTGGSASSLFSPSLRMQMSNNAAQRHWHSAKSSWENFSRSTEQPNPTGSEENVLRCLPCSAHPRLTHPSNGAQRTPTHHTADGDVGSTAACCDPRAIAASLDPGDTYRWAGCTYLMISHTCVWSMII